VTLHRTDWKGLVGALGLLLVSATLILAHDLFLKPESFLLPPQSDVRIAVLNGSFTASEASVTPDRLRDLSLVGPAASRTASRWWSARRAAIQAAWCASPSNRRGSGP
jgi:hypothetical protein